MSAPFDVFEAKDEPGWLGSAKTLDEAIELAREAGAGPYFVLSQPGGLKSFFDVDSDRIVSPLR
jgi:hypothetical protein